MSIFFGNGVIQKMNAIRMTLVECKVCLNAYKKRLKKCIRYYRMYKVRKV